MATSGKNCRKTQDELLMKILKHQTDTEYGIKYRFKEITSREEFKKRHPLTTYGHYREYMDRIANGEENVLTKDHVKSLTLSSGTTEEHKKYCVTDSLDTRHMAALLQAKSHIPQTFYQQAKVGLKRIFPLRIYYPFKPSPAGIPIGGFTLFMKKKTLENYHIFPDIDTDVGNAEPHFYVQAIFALLERDISLIESFSSDIMLGFFKFMDEHWHELCEDIERGCIRSFHNLNEDARRELNTYLLCDPRRAEELRKAFQTGMKGKGTRLWPSLGGVVICRTGGFALAAEILMDTYLQGVLVNYTLHGSIEGRPSLPGNDRLYSGSHLMGQRQPSGTHFKNTLKSVGNV